MTTGDVKHGRPQRTPLLHCPCGEVIPRQDKNIGAVVCPKCAEQLQEAMRAHLESGRVRFIELKVAA